MKILAHGVISSKLLIDTIDSMGGGIGGQGRGGGRGEEGEGERGQGRGEGG